VAIDAEVVHAVPVEPARVHVPQQVVEQDVATCGGAGVEAREELAADLGPGPADLALEGPPSITVRARYLVDISLPLRRPARARRGRAGSGAPGCASRAMPRTAGSEESPKRA